MMEKRRPPWVDGEKIPDDLLQDMFRPPPSMPDKFYRSSLIVGARGSGKTTLFRYLKTVHDGIATDISLATELASITKQTGIGPLSFEASPDVEPMIIGKSISLIAISIVRNLAKKGIPIPRHLLLGCLPDDKSSFELDDYSSLLSKIASMSLDSFLGIAESRPLIGLISTLGKNALQIRGPLLLLFDRADMIPAPALIPLFELLDQSSEQIVLIATRPGLVGESIDEMAEVFVPGDTYDVIHLGAEPRSEEWIRFVQAAVEAQFGSGFTNIPQEIKSWISFLARDSVRWALELTNGFVYAPSQNQALKSAISNLQENLIAAGQRTLREYLPDFRHLINDVRKEAIKLDPSLSAPVVISIPRLFPHQVTPTVTQIDRLMTLALRIGALCVVEGQRWVPGLRLAEFEIPPLLLWKEGDSPARQFTKSPLVVERTEKLLLAKGGGAYESSPKVFVAFRLDFEESKSFRANIEDTIKRYPGLSRIEIIDGKVPDGARWADAIRERIKKSKAVFGDVTGMRVDVIFELGLAYGLGRPIIPAVSKQADKGLIPRWLGATQVGHFENQAGLTSLAASLSEHFTNPEFQKFSKPPQPVPGLSIWMGNLGDHAREQFETQGRREGLNVEVIDTNFPPLQAIQRASSASLLVVGLDGTENDAFIHFICGAIVAKPKAGYGRTFDRRIIVIESPSVSLKAAADSLLRCEHMVIPISLNAITTSIKIYGDIYRKWTNTPTPHERKKG